MADAGLGLVRLGRAVRVRRERLRMSRNGLACSYVFRLLVVVSPRVYRLGGELVLDVLSHELGHLWVGVSCRRVREWQVAHFGDLLPSRVG